jgi:hypothetical protein
VKVLILPLSARHGGEHSSGTVRGTVPDQLGSAVQQLRESGVEVTYCSCGASGLQQFFSRSSAIGGTYQPQQEKANATGHPEAILTGGALRVESSAGVPIMTLMCSASRQNELHIREGQLRMERPLKSTHTLLPCKSGVKRRNISFTNT